MLGKVAITVAGAGGQVTILTSLSQVPSIPPPSVSPFTDGQLVRISYIKIKIKIKMSIGNLGVVSSKRWRAKSLFLSGELEIDMQYSP